MSPELLEAIYETSLDPASWKDAIERIVAVTGSEGGQILLLDERDPSASFSMYVADTASPDADRLYVEHYGAIDPRRQHVMSKPIGRWLGCHHICDERFVRRSEFYQDYLIPTVGCRYIAGARLSDDDGLHTMLAIGRAAAGNPRPYDDEDLRLFDQLTPHLVRAARLQGRLRRLQTDLAVRDAALDRVAMAIAIVDRSLLLRHANAAGEAFLQDGAGPLSSRFGRLVCRSAQESGWLAAAVKAAVDERKGDARVLAADGGLPRCTCVVIPLSPRLPQAVQWQRPMAMLLFTDSTLANPVERRTLQRLFGLTPAEATLAAGLAGGQTLEAIAASRSISIMTVRAQLRAVFTKVGVSRQADLVSLLQRLALARTSADPSA